MPSCLDLFWLISSLGIGVAAAITIFTPHLTFIADLTKYGVSASNKRSSFHRILEVPKRWFTHFYITASVCSGLALFLVVSVYLWRIPPPPALSNLLRTLGSPHAKATVSETGVVLTSAMLVVHTLRRLSESLFTSVYSDTRMNVLHYALGHLHYIALPLAILAEAPEFTARPGMGTSAREVRWVPLSLVQWAAVALYLFASYHQHGTFHKLAAMRRGYTGNITTYAHGVVYGGWHDLISCPHFFFEILLYVSFFAALQGANITWHYVALFVFTNQILAGVITHRWYKERFGASYPSQRFAVIPYVL